MATFVYWAAVGPQRWVPTFVYWAAVGPQRWVPPADAEVISITKGLVSHAHVAGSPSQCPHCAHCPPPSLADGHTSGLSGVAAGSRWQVGSACETAGSAARGAGGCCWVGRALCTTRAAPSPAPHCTCGKRRGVHEGSSPGQHMPTLAPTPL